MSCSKIPAPAQPKAVLISCYVGLELYKQVCKHACETSVTLVGMDIRGCHWIVNCWIMHWVQVCHTVCCCTTNLLLCTLHSTIRLAYHMLLYCRVLDDVVVLNMGPDWTWGSSSSTGLRRCAHTLAALPPARQQQQLGESVVATVCLV